MLILQLITQVLLRVCWNLGVYSLILLTKNTPICYEETLIMILFKHLSRFTILAVALTLGLTTNVPAQVQAQPKPSSPSSKLPNQSKNSFRPPRTATGVPTNTEGGATRGEGCQKGEIAPVPLVPVASQTGETVADYPTFFWYMPKTSAEEVEFVLQDEENDKDVYKVTYALAKSADGVVGDRGLMSITLPAFANLSPLEMGKEYTWEVALICESKDRSRDVVTKGLIKRVAPDPALALRIQQATPQQRVALYKDAQLWYDAVSTLVELQRTRPDDANLPVAWDRLLSSAGL